MQAENNNKQTVFNLGDKFFGNIITLRSCMRKKDLKQSIFSEALFKLLEHC